MFQKGDKVKITAYGVEYNVTVSRNQTSSIVWVRMPSGFERWFHQESVTKR